MNSMFNCLQPNILYMYTNWLKVWYTYAVLYHIPYAEIFSSSSYIGTVLLVFFSIHIYYIRHQEFIVVDALCRYLVLYSIYSPHKMSQMLNS